MKEFWTTPGLPFLPQVPWWVVVVVSFTLGAVLGKVVRSIRTEGPTDDD